MKQARPVEIALITWLAGSRARRVSSFGKLSFFNVANAPDGAPERCTDGCPVAGTCEFNALKQYIDPGFPQIPFSLLTGVTFGSVLDFYMRYPRLRELASHVLTSGDRDGRINELKRGSHGRCVFRCDNDVVDHQIVNIEYENGMFASFALSAFSAVWERTLNLNGTQGEIRSADLSGKVEIRSFNPIKVRLKRIRFNPLFHGGSDGVVLIEFAKAVKQVRQAKAPDVLTGARDVLESHLLCFAAEKARTQGKVVDMADFRQAAYP